MPGDIDFPVDDRIAVVATLLVALTLLAAPVTMGDWGEQASHSVEAVDESGLVEGTPVIEYESLSPTAQAAVRDAIESRVGMHTVYGTEDWPNRFRYSDSASPGSGIYGIEYEGQLYELRTAAGAGFVFIYWLYQLPFVLFGLVLWPAGTNTQWGDAPPAFAATGAVAGVAFHLLGPEFDFPLVEPRVFAALGVVALVAYALGYVRYVWGWSLQ